MLRLFVAAYPHAAWATEALRILDALSLPPRARITPASALHLTLQFIGDTPEKELSSIIESVERSAAGIASFHLAPVQCIALPGRGPARSIALELEPSPLLLELHARLASRLARRRSGKSDQFLPHVTMCRFEPITSPFGPHDAADLPPLFVTEIRLVRSVLCATGAVHTTLRRVNLGETHDRKPSQRTES